MRHHLTRIAVALTMLSTFPPGAFAQRESAALVGTVRDESGLVVPGVTVEATSPALIERSKTTVTDGQGQFRIVDLRPGSYTVAFNLEGFGRTTHEGIALVVGFTATVDAVLKAAGVEESVIVSGRSDVVDLQNTARRSNLNRTF